MTRATGCWWAALPLLFAMGAWAAPASAQPDAQDDPDTPLDESSAVDEDETPPAEPEAEEAAAEADSASSDGVESDEAESGARDDDLEEPGQTIVYQEPEPPAGDDAFNLILPPFVYDRRAGTETIALFPLFYSRSNAESQELLIPPYYLQRGTNNWDVLFPLFWWYRGAGHHTWILPFVHSHQAPDGFDFGVSPFVYAGRHDDHHYTLVPPLLYFDWGVDDEERFTFAALFWRIQEQRQEHWGIFPGPLGREHGVELLHHPAAALLPLRGLRRGHDADGDPALLSPRRADRFVLRSAAALPPQQRARATRRRPSSRS